MKQGRLAGIIFSVASIALIVIYIILSIGLDRSAPEFSYQETNILYKAGMDLSELLTGVSAYDSVDGDMTERIVVEKVIEDRESGSAVVFYAVSDLSGNAAKSSRVFKAVFDDMDGEADIVEEESEGNFPEAGIDAEMNLSGKTILTGEDTDVTEEDFARENEEETTPAPVVTPIPTPIQEPTPQPTLAPTPKPAPTIDPAVPILTLKVSEVKVKAGQGPAWVNIIGNLSDDKDSYETLFRNLNVSKYDRDKAGSYGVNVYTEDSDGNQSQSVPLTIIVE